MPRAFGPAAPVASATARRSGRPSRGWRTTVPTGSRASSGSRRGFEGRIAAMAEDEATLRSRGCSRRPACTCGGVDRAGAVRGLVRPRGGGPAVLGFDGRAAGGCVAADHARAAGEIRRKGCTSRWSRPSGSCSRSPRRARRRGARVHGRLRRPRRRSHRDAIRVARPDAAEPGRGRGQGWSGFFDRIAERLAA